MVNKQRGFTLVEIAIVLVIIGLLLGGILKGQELITAARVRNLADQAAGVQAAYYGFIDRYRAVPGDMPGNQVCNAIGNTVQGCAGGNGVGGDGDQVIENFSEAAATWAHLAAAGFIQGSFRGNATAADYNSTAIQPPAAPTNPWNGFLLLGRTNEYMTLAGTTPAARLHLIIGRFVPVNVMREYDLKVDDSLPDNGIVRAPTTTASTFAPVSGSTGNCVTTAAPLNWDINQNSADCNAYFLF